MDVEVLVFIVEPLLSAFSMLEPPPPLLSAFSAAFAFASA
jgi:hypothetical protein